MIKKLFFIAGSSLFGILFCPSEHVRHLPKLVLCHSVLAFVYALLIVKEFKTWSMQYYFIQVIDFYMGLNSMSIFVVVLVTISFPIYLVIHWDDMQNKTFLIIFISLELSIILVLSCLWV